MTTKPHPEDMPAEKLVRYCPGCGSVGPVEAKYRDCCPDGNEARMIPEALANKCRDTFKIAIRNIYDEKEQASLAEQRTRAMREIVRLPQTDDEVADFIGANFEAMWTGEGEDGVRRYKLSAHDLLSSFREWEEGFSTPPSAPGKGEAEGKDAARYRWLCENARVVGEHWGGRWSLVIEGPYNGLIGEAIDAAMNLPAAPAQSGEKAE